MPKFPKNYVPVNVDLLSQPDFPLKKKQKYKGFYGAQSRFSLHMLLPNPKPGIVSFETNLTILHKTAGITHPTFSLLPCKADAD